jgi:hypothetical protein
MNGMIRRTTPLSISNNIEKPRDMYDMHVGIEISMT